MTSLRLRVARVLALAAGLVAGGCSGRDGAPTTPARDGGEAVAVVQQCAPPDATRVVNVQEGVVYSTPGGQAQHLDVAWPTAPGPHPLVVLIHGGGWSTGSRLDLRSEMVALARMGFVASSVDYRLARAPQNVFPAAVQDVRCALRWLRSSAATYGMDPARAAAVGFSAGGHLAAMLGVGASASGLDDPACPAASSPASVAGVVSYAGPQDVRVSGPYTVEQAVIVSNFLGVFPGDAPALAALASPITHVSPASPPFLFVHGTADALVPVDQSRRMRAALRAAGVPATLLELPGVGHQFVSFGSTTAPQVGCTILAFLERTLRGAMPASAR